MTNTAYAGVGSLRQAIIDANARVGADQIRFSLGSTPATIRVLSALPTITDTLDIDGTLNFSRGVVLDGSGAGLSANGLTLQNHDGSRIVGLVINQFGGSGILIRGGSTHFIGGNYIGTDLTGKVAKGNGLDGITIENSSRNTIGDVTGLWFPVAPNLLSGNGRDGVRIFGTSTENKVGGNYIGTNVDWSAALGNKHDGIAILDRVSKTTIGGPEIQPPPPYTTGVYKTGLQMNGGNIISGNARHGVFISGATETIIRSNDIGWVRGYERSPGDFHGAIPMANGGDGISLTGAANSSIELNNIANNLGNGITLSASNNNKILFNIVGFMNDVVSYGNKGDGIRIESGSSHNSIGVANGTSMGVAFNSSAGIRILGGNDNRITSVNFTENGDLPIARGPLAPVATEPTIDSVVASPTSTRVSGRIHGPANRQFQIDIYYSMPGDDKSFSFAGTATVTTDARGDATFSQSVASFALALTPNNQIKYRATATDLVTGETSQISSTSRTPNVVGGYIRGNTFLDTNRNGVQDTNETAGGHASVFLDKNLNGQLDAGELSAETDSAGSFNFAIDADGVYRVQVIPLDNLTVGGSDRTSVSVTAGNTVSSVKFAIVSQTQIQNQKLVAMGQGGGSGQVVVTDANGAIRKTFVPFSGFRGAVHVATGDVNGDGQMDVIVAAGAGGGPHVRVFDGNDLAAGLEPRIIREFFAYSDDFRGGVNVAAANVNGDGKADIITGAGPGGGPHVRVFDGATGREIASYFAYSTDFRGGVEVAAGKLLAGGSVEVITGAGPGGGPHVRILNALTGIERTGFYAFDGAYRGGVNVAVGDLTGDGTAEIVTGAIAGLASVRIFDGRTVAFKQSLTPFGDFSGGVSIGVLDIDGSGANCLLVGAGAGGGPHVRFLDGVTFDERKSLFAFDPAFRGGVFVG